MSDNATACIVTYFETRAAVAGEAVRILADYAGARAAAPRLLWVDLLARHGAPGQFALIETGAEVAVRDGAAAATRDAALAPLLLAPGDRRDHAALAVASRSPAAVSTAGAVWVVTHVDVVPAHKDSGVARVREHAAASRGRRGCLRFEAWQQADRPNHMTLVEAWTDVSARDAHRAADETRDYRDRLARIVGALYDERTYSRLAP
jgi:quinol monooxygenase YgiN